jgi:signal recognition particle subunit SEC65
VDSVIDHSLSRFLARGLAVTRPALKTLKRALGPLLLLCACCATDVR